MILWRPLVRLGKVSMWIAEVAAIAVLVCSAVSYPALAEPGVRHYDVSAQPLADALQALAAQANSQIIFEKPSVEGIQSKGLQGDFTFDKALLQLLKGTNLEHVIGSDGVIIVRPRQKPASAPVKAIGPLDPPLVDSGSIGGSMDEIVVTARKRSETVLNVPISVTAFSADSLDRLNITSFTDYATQVPNMAFSYGTAELGFGSSRAVAIRGISGAGTVGVYIDDTPVPESIDPRVIDIARIEVLKGPQGTLFGQGSLGGNLRIITTQPYPADPNIHLQARLGATSGGGSPDFGVNFAGSHVLIDERVTARLVAFADNTAGYLTRTYPSGGNLVSVNNQGAVHSYGGSLAVLWSATSTFSVTARVMYQHSKDYGLPAAYASLPGFTIQSYTLNRVANIPEASTDNWYLPSLTLNYRGEKFNVVSSTSYFDRRVVDTEDDSEGTQWIFNNLGYLPKVSFTQPFPWQITIPQRRTTNETRLSFEPISGFSGTVGVYYSRQYSNEFDAAGNLPGLAGGGYTNFPGYCPGATPCPSYNSDLIWYSAYPLNRTDGAAFGEAYYDLGPWQFTAGLRAYEGRQQLSFVTAGAVNGTYNEQHLPKAKQTGVTPKVSVSFKLDANATLYASAAKGFRAGGTGQSLQPTCDETIVHDLGLTTGEAAKFNSDSVWNYEVGGKVNFADSRLVLTGALFQMNWSNIQQNLTVPGCFVNITVNEGAARARGGELEISGRPLDRLEIRAGFGYDDAKITKQGLPILPPVGSRVAQIPELTENLSGTFSQAINERLTAFITADASHTGASDSYTSALGYPLTRAGYSLLNGSLGVRWDRSELSLYAANITNQRPNLGDINPAGYVRHDGTGPGAPIVPRVATLQPFNAGIQFRQKF